MSLLAMSLGDRFCMIIKHGTGRDGYIGSPGRVKMTWLSLSLAVKTPGLELNGSFLVLRINGP